MFQPGTQESHYRCCGPQSRPCRGRGSAQRCHRPAMRRRWTAAVDVRGGGPGTRETDALSPENLVGRAHALVLAGGSVFGLGRRGWRRGSALRLGFGLQFGEKIDAHSDCTGRGIIRPGKWRRQNLGTWSAVPRSGNARLAARRSGIRLRIGGCGTRRDGGSLKGGIGSAPWICERDSSSGHWWRSTPSVRTDARRQDLLGLAVRARPGIWRRGTAESAMDLSDPAHDDSRLAGPRRMAAGTNTTLGVVACNADLNTAECRRIAMMAQDGIARALRPAHTPFDGDTVFALASGELPLKTNPFARRKSGASARRPRIAWRAPSPERCTRAARFRRVLRRKPPPPLESQQSMPACMRDAASRKPHL